MSLLTPLTFPAAAAVTVSITVIVTVTVTLLSCVLMLYAGASYTTSCLIPYASLPLSCGCNRRECVRTKARPGTIAGVR